MPRAAAAGEQGGEQRGGYSCGEAAHGGGEVPAVSSPVRRSGLTSRPRREQRTDARRRPADEPAEQDARDEAQVVHEIDDRRSREEGAHAHHERPDEAPRWAFAGRNRAPRLSMDAGDPRGREEDGHGAEALVEAVAALECPEAHPAPAVPGAADDGASRPEAQKPPWPAEQRSSHATTTAEAMSKWWCAARIPAAISAASPGPGTPAQLAAAAPSPTVVPRAPGRGGAGG